MDEKIQLGKNKVARGRPRNEARQPVSEQLLQATELLLQGQSHFDLTETQIAASAGTDKAMIHYYFGSKDGLFCELVRRLTDDWNEKLKALDTLEVTAERDITRQIFKILIDVYYSKPWVTRIMVSEFSRNDSVIRKLYFERCGPRGLAYGHLRQIIERLIKMGIYNAQVDAGNTGMSMMFIVAAPLLLAQISGDLGYPLDDCKKDDWITHLVDLFNARLNVNQ